MFQEGPATAVARHSGKLRGGTRNLGESDIGSRKILTDSHSHSQIASYSRLQLLCTHSKPSIRLRIVPAPVGCLRSPAPNLSPDDLRTLHVVLATRVFTCAFECRTGSSLIATLPFEPSSVLYFRTRQAKRNLALRVASTSFSLDIRHPATLSGPTWISA